MFANLNGWHAIILLVIILLLFGAPKLPALARSLGQSMKIFKNEVKTEQKGDAETGAGDAPTSETESKQ
ncbi:twin-arginine translocase TatA/TatE family subunit [Ruicaihuangia caeni]|uniref:Sec-independent protein translocase protein TatA n=1 Tax=Ruicaihuangia caeni TaxID=3042517 RepID=A0AAW6T309_9MICO|nr:twin-arginine translocase TatA/TatE family subunit [Klugiella sp. YN-L-19]MDI2098196.1 twin-arginine translocase TatA/TatE family subunit [Klugiella sp. YN-L-19]